MNVIIIEFVKLLNEISFLLKEYLAKLNPRFNEKIGMQNAVILLIIKNRPISSLFSLWDKNDKMNIPIKETKSCEKNVRERLLKNDFKN